MDFKGFLVILFAQVCLTLLCRYDTIQLKYYIKAAFSWIFTAALAVMAVSALIGDEISIRVRTAEIYEQLTASAQPLVIDINSASVRELQKLNGIGEVTANAIIVYREENGTFNSFDELLNVRGIGQATLEKILPYIIL